MQYALTKENLLEAFKFCKKKRKKGIQPICFCRYVNMQMFSTFYFLPKWVTHFYEKAQNHEYTIYWCLFCSWKMCTYLIKWAWKLSLSLKFDKTTTTGLRVENYTKGGFSWDLESGHEFKLFTANIWILKLIFC